MLAELTVIETWKDKFPRVVYEIQAADETRVITALDILDGLPLTVRRSTFRGDPIRRIRCEVTARAPEIVSQLRSAGWEIKIKSASPFYWHLLDPESFPRIDPSSL